ncbi:DUF4394 domain-containing protein [Dokdonella soli]|uniref:DUF4394 domain-containing protein n=1 Tax=Dokdonella soli TaxID=529810 RepID=A0ABN1ILH0_9GAMM
MKAQLAIAAALLAFAGSAAATHDHATSPRPQSSTGPGQSIGAPTVTAGIDLVTTLTPWTSGPISCSTATTLGINPGDSFGVCYTVTNHSGRELDWHYLQANNGFMASASYFNNQLNQRLADGASLQFTYPVQNLVWQSTDINSIWTAQDAPPPVYSFDDTVPFAFVDLSQSPTATMLIAPGTGGTSTTADVTMPFSFRFYEHAAANQLCVTLSGAILVGQPGCHFGADSNFGQMPIIFASDLIMPAWTIWNSTLDGGTVYADTQGTAPNRRFIVEWQGMTRNHTPGPGITFEAVIDEATSQITFQYQSMAFNDGGNGNGFPGDYGASSTAGIQRDYGANGVAPTYLQYSWWQPVLTNGKAIRWTPGPMPYSVTATSTAHIEVLSAAITANPTAIQASAAVGASTTAPVTIGNAGNTALAWVLGQTPASSGFHFATPYVGSLATPVLAHYSASNPDPRDAVRAHAGASNAFRTSASVSQTSTARVPAYAIGSISSGSRYVSLDALAPQTLTQNNYDVSTNQVGGFIDNDFTKQYLQTNGGCDFNSCWGFQFYWLGNNGSGNGTRIVASGAAPSAPSPTIAGELWHGMKWDATTHTVYAVASTDTAPNRTDLYAIDPRFGSPTWIAKLDRVSLNGTRMLDIAIAPNGAMYGIDEATDSLYAIDKTNGHLRLIGATGLDAGIYDLQSMDFDQSSGILYYAAFPLTPTVSSIYTVDLTTGHAKLIGPFGDGSIAVSAFAIAVPGGPCVSPTSVPWLSFDHSSGTTLPGQSDTVTATLNAGNLTDGTYHANICVYSNTRFDSTVALPVTFSVGVPDRIFANGFE